MRSLFLLWTVFVLASPAAAQCAGDCNSDNEVTIDEIILAVGIALGDRQVSACTAVDRNNDREVTIDEVLAAVNSALAGCPPSGPQVHYDRSQQRSTTPFPDDFWLTADSSQLTGVRLDVPVPDGPADIQGIYRALLRDTNLLGRIVGPQRQHRSLRCHPG